MFNVQVAKNIVPRFTEPFDLPSIVNVISPANRGSVQCLFDLSNRLVGNGQTA